MATKNLTYLQGNTLFMSIPISTEGNMPLVAWAIVSYNGSEVLKLTLADYVAVDGSYIKVIVPPDVMATYFSANSTYDYAVYYKYWEADKVTAQSGTLAVGSQADLTGDVPDAGDGTLTIGSILHYALDPANADADIIADGLALADGETTEYTTGIADPDFPRMLVVTGKVSGMTGNVVIEGTNFQDEEITETIALNGINAVNGTKAFKTVTSITVPAWNADGDTVDVGTQNKFGMPSIIANASCLLVKLFNGSADTGTLTVDSDEIEKNTFAINGTPDGTKVLDLYYIKE